MLRRDVGTLGVLKDVFRFKWTPNSSSPGPKKCSFVMFSAQKLCKEKGKEVQEKSKLAAIREGVNVYWQSWHSHSLPLWWVHQTNQSETKRAPDFAKVFLWILHFGNNWLALDFPSACSLLSVLYFPALAGAGGVSVWLHYFIISGNPKAGISTVIAEKPLLLHDESTIPM